MDIVSAIRWLITLYCNNHKKGSKNHLVFLSLRETAFCHLHFVNSWCLNYYTYTDAFCWESKCFLSVAWLTGVQLLVFFCSSVPVVVFITPGISRCRSQHVVAVESSSLFHHSTYLWFICFPWWSIDELENLYADWTTVCFEPWQKPRARLGSRKTGLNPPVF